MSCLAGLPPYNHLAIRAHDEHAEDQKAGLQGSTDHMHWVLDEIRCGKLVGYIRLL